MADLSLAGQAKLLRFLENGEFYKVGGTRKYTIHTRVVSATNKDLDQLVAQEKFRRDLYFRLCVVTAKIPSLNERPDAIIPLAKHFLHEFNLKFNKKLKRISAQALLEAHEFIGNVRELKNIIERSVLVARNQLVCVAKMGLLTNGSRGHSDASQKETLTQIPRLPEEGVHLNDLLSGIEREYMALAMKRARGDESAAAKLLNMNHHTFRYRWKKMSKN